MSELQQWTQGATDGASLRDLAAKLNANHVTIGRKLRDNDPQLAVDIARAYGHNPIDALLAIHFIDQEDVNAYSRHIGIREYSDLELAEDMLARIRERGSDSLENVTEFPGANVARLPYAADNSDTEPEPGDDDYHDGP